MGWLLVVAGLFSIAGAVKDWDFFMNHHKAQFFIRLFGRQGTRIFYGILGTILSVLGLLAGLGIIR